MALEQKEGKRVEADVITWRGMMTKVSYIIMFNMRQSANIIQFMAAIFSDRDG
jgi:hypothetical protein